MNIRPALPDDLPAILHIYNDAILNTTATAEYYPHTLDMRREWYDSHQRDNLPIFVAENDQGRVIGWSSLSRFHSRYGYRFTAEDSVYVAADSRGMGAGKALLPPLIDSARTLGLHVILASIDSDNEASIRLHQRYGFEIVGRLNEVIYKFDRWLSTVLMELRLE
jgi:phosphinothricin acetyltransferase